MYFTFTNHTKVQGSLLVAFSKQGTDGKMYTSPVDHVVISSNIYLSALTCLLLINILHLAQAETDTDLVHSHGQYRNWLV